MSELVHAPYVISSHAVAENPLGLNQKLVIPVQDDYDPSLTYDTVLKAFCASRSCDLNVRRQVVAENDPVQIVALVTDGEIVPAWDACKEFYLSAIIRFRFDEAEARKALIDTGTTIIVVKDQSLSPLWPTAHTWLAGYLSGLRRTFQNAIRSD